jgi:tetratricopeptide (TPR) repeat protein
MSAAAALPGGDAARIEAFRRLLETARAPETAADSPVLLTDRLVGPLAGDLLRCCAVPHEFDAALLARIGGLSAEAAEQRYAQFSELSLVQIAETSLSVHERWRQPLWRWWLDDARRERFVALNEMLVAWFTCPASPTGEDPAARRRMFHLLGCRHEEGWAEFDRLFRTARHRRRFSECSLLLVLVGEYAPRLSPQERALLRYHEGKIAIDLRRWAAALPLLRSVVDDPDVDPRLRVNAQARLAHALRQSQQADEAQAVLTQALSSADADPQAARSRWRVLYELGEVQRDLGQIDRAAQTLAGALVSAGQDEEADVAGMLNSLGTVQLKLRDFDAAIDSFSASLDRLRRDGDALRPGTVLNNLGLARLERCDWPAAEAAFSESLQSKRAAGDVLGQATTLLNLGRAQAAQGHNAKALTSAEDAERLFAQGGDDRGAAAARQARGRLGTTAVEAGGRTGGRPDGGLPWWAWVLIGLGVLLLALIVLGSV